MPEELAPVTGNDVMIKSVTFDNRGYEEAMYDLSPT